MGGRRLTPDFRLIIINRDSGILSGKRVEIFRKSCSTNARNFEKKRTPKKPPSNDLRFDGTTGRATFYECETLVE